MGQYAVVIGGVVDNVVLASPDWAAARGLVLIADGAWIGWTWDGTSFAPPPPPEA